MYDRKRPKAVIMGLLRNHTNKKDRDNSVFYESRIGIVLVILFRFFIGAWVLMALALILALCFDSIPYEVGDFLMVAGVGIITFIMSIVVLLQGYFRANLPISHNHSRTYYGSSATNSKSHSGSSGSLFTSMTSDYYGKHGEFDSNDRDRAYNEDMFSMRHDDPNSDIEEHYGWENKLNYDSDGYPEEENW